MTKEAKNGEQPVIFDWEEKCVSSYQNFPDGEVASVVGDLKNLNGQHPGDEIARFIGTILRFANPEGQPEKHLISLSMNLMR